MSVLRLHMNEPMAEILDEVCESRGGITRAEGLRRSVLLMHYLSEMAMQGSEILIVDRETGEAERLVMATSLLTNSTEVA